MAILILVFFYHCTQDRGCVGLEDNIVSYLKAEVHNPVKEEVKVTVKMITR